MRTADLSGIAATPKGLRHSFGVLGVVAAVPPTLIQRWMGHSDISTMAIYLNASGDAERLIAIRMWQEVLRPDPFIARFG